MIPQPWSHCLGPRLEGALGWSLGPGLVQGALGSSGASGAGPEASSPIQLRQTLQIKHGRGAQAGGTGRGSTQIRKVICRRSVRRARAQCRI